MQLPPYQPPPAQTPRPLDKPLARARRSFRLHHLFPHNCRSRLPAPTDSNARRAWFRLAQKTVSPMSLRSLGSLQIWRYIFYYVATSRPCPPLIANPTTCIPPKHIPSKRPLRPSVLPPAKRRRSAIQLDRSSITTLADFANTSILHSSLSHLCHSISQRVAFPALGHSMRNLGG